MSFSHISVMLAETVDSLKVCPGKIYVDGTVGGGGHAYEIARRLEGKGMLIGIDQDGDAVAAATEHLSEFRGLVRIVRRNYSQIKTILVEQGIEKVDGILLDLGVSSYQLDTVDRGFSYKEDAPLDMRMDRRKEKTARDIVNEYREGELYRIIRDYGEERFAGNIARHIVASREKKAIETTTELSDIIRDAIPLKCRMRGGHPAKRTFQAIRIELNQELEVLSDALEEMIEFLTEGGRISVITFHSLEDRIVKNAFRKAEKPCTCPPEFPVCMCGKLPKGVVITKKPVVPSAEELEQNPRSRSAKLRVLERRGE